MTAEAYRYVVLGALAGALAGIIIMWSRQSGKSRPTSPWRTGTILIAGTGAIATAMAAFVKVFGADSAIHGPITVVLVTSWFGILNAVVPLPLPKHILSVSSREVACLRARLTGIRWFGSLLRRTPLRHLGGRVYLSETEGDPSPAIHEMIADQKLHLWALLGTLPWFATWTARGRWLAVLGAILVHIPLNIFPVLHLRLTLWRTERCQSRLRRRRNPMSAGTQT